MRSSALRKYCCLAFVPLGLFVFSVQAHTFAQGYPVEEESDNNFGLAIDPPYNSLELENNRFGEVTIKVENTNPFNIYVTPSVRDINIIDNQPQFVPLEDAEYPLSPFLEFSIEQFLIKEGESVDFTIEVVPPDDDPSEFLFGAVFFTAS
ncbi:MAG: hypothetical protein U9Q67_05075, partial [Patescibacteria group bacterium]|nr:hypothetical protein [Patescibacteria group bacterium]